MKVKLLRATAVLGFAVLVNGAMPALAQTSGQPPAQTTEPAQTSQSSKTVKLFDLDYTKGQPGFPNIFKPYTSIHPAEPVLTNTPGINELIKDGKLTLSLQDAVTLALENNLDISVQRYATYLADTDVLKAKAGPGSSSPFGPFINFDPTLTSVFGWNRSSFPVNNPFLSGTGSAGLSTLTNQTSTGNFGYTQGFATGTNFSASLNNTRQSTTSPAQLFNPSVTSSLVVQFQQSLLNGFGFGPNLRFLRVARNSRKIADLAFQQQLITTVTAVETAYYELVFAQEDVQVKQRSVELAQKLYNDNKRQVEIGTLAPIEVTRAESEVARARGDLIVAQTLALQQEIALKNFISRELMNPALIGVSVFPVDRVTKPIDIPTVPLQDAVNEAKQKRPDVRQAVIDLDSRGITAKATRNALLPTLTLSGQYGTQGLSGNQITRIPAGLVAGTLPIVTANGTPVLIAGNQIFTSSTATTPGPVTENGLGDALRNVFESNFPNYAVQLNLTIPIRNRSAQADNDRAQLSQRQGEVILRRLENSVVVDVRNTQIAMEQNRARVDAAIRARILAEQTLDAEQKKFQLGASTIFLVIQAQRDLATSRSTEVRALVDLTESKINFERALGRTLEVNKIDIADTRHDKIERVPLIPGTKSSEMAGGSGKF
jgi:outer membrane protein